MTAMNRRRVSRFFLRASLVSALPLVMGAAGDEEGARGCGALGSQSEVPNMAGTWDVAYDDSLAVEIAIGGAIYTAELGAQGGVVEIDHEGQPIQFEIDCTRPEVLCASEAFPAVSVAEHREPNLPHAVHFTAPVQRCDGTIVAADPAECGEGTDNPDCADVCDGELITEDVERTGIISENGDYFDMFLGADVASNGVNCGLLAVSVLAAEIESNDPEAEEGWEAERLTGGTIDLAYAGACLWADDANMDGELEAAALSASIKLTTGFTATKQ